MNRGDRGEKTERESDSERKYEVNSRRRWNPESSLIEKLTAI